MMTKFLSRRALAAARIFSTIACVVTSGFIVEMAAAFGIHLIFQMTAAQSRVFKHLNRVRHVQRFTETRVCVNERGQIRRVGHRAAAGSDFGQRR